MGLMRRIGNYFATGKMDKVKSELRELMLYIFDNQEGIASPNLGLDIDGTLDVNPRFFEILSIIWPGRISIITLREDSEDTRMYLDKLKIRYDRLVSVKKLEDKAKAIIKYNINVFIDDQDEALYNIPENVMVLKIRDPGGNFENGKWLYSNQTGTNINDKTQQSI
jgi:hypothetical protein